MTLGGFGAVDALTVLDALGIICAVGILGDVLGAVGVLCQKTPISLANYKYLNCLDPST